MAELQVSIRSDKASKFINTLDRILTKEEVSETAEDTIAELMSDCFGIGKVHEDLRIKLIQANNTINRLANALYEEWEKRDNDYAYDALMDCELLEMPMGDLKRL